MAVLLLALVLGAFPSASETAWMRPEAFRLAIGMPRADAVRVLREKGWEIKPGRDENEIVVDYTGDKALTLAFRKGRLQSVRFELFAMLPGVPKAFEEAKGQLRKDFGRPKAGIAANSIVIYDGSLPNVMLVMSADAKSELGKRGLGFVAIRYFDPR
ncbi:MAG: hypothetical protein WA208_05565 [Thermoanaerobaculia bacterium]